MRIVTLAPETGYRAPTSAELGSLLKIVRAAYTWLPDIPDDRFARSMWAVGHMFSVAEPDASFISTGTSIIAATFSRNFPTAMTRTGIAFSPASSHTATSISASPTARDSCSKSD
jgi:hypothetical protein